MQVQRIQNNNFNPQFCMKITPSDSVKYAVLTARDLMESPLYCEVHRDFVQEFCNSLARILKSNQAERIWATVCRGTSKEVAPSYVEEYYKKGKPKHVLSLPSIQKDEHSDGHTMYSQEGGNMMRTLIEYAKTIKDVPEQKIDFKDDYELTHYAYKSLAKDLHNSITGFYYPIFKK